MTQQRIKLAISTCPNDTFAFHALMERLVDCRGLDFEVDLMDIQELNDGIDQGRFDVAKASFHAALRWTESMVVLPSGSALGFGVGPLLLAAKSNSKPESIAQLTLCPGKDTTATLLFKLFYPNTTRVDQALFSQIMPKLESGEADFGVCIHEGRFTWQESGLSLVEDLGTRWEAETNCPLPLGGIVAKTSLADEKLERVQAVIRDSILFAQQSPESALPTMRRYAQEFDDVVLMKHVELYVNPWTIDLGETGRAALDELSRRALQVGLIEAGTKPLRVWS
ncbi:MAG: 1,4-dihydroxy-6-naphthoate synthase [Pirellulales bacterium]